MRDRRQRQKGSQDKEKPMIEKKRGQEKNEDREVTGIEKKYERKKIEKIQERSNQ